MLMYLMPASRAALTASGSVMPVRADDSFTSIGRLTPAITSMLP